MKIVSAKGFRLREREREREEKSQKTQSGIDKWRERRN
jgi:hypothetical protein